MLGESVFRESSLCVVGNINRDVKTAAIPAVDNLFQDGETSVSSVIETIGGGGANSACAAAALGAQATFLGKTGDDGLAARLDRTLARHGVNARLSRDKKVATGTSLALSFENGHRHFLSCLPASRSLSLGDLDLALLEGHKHLLRADIWFSESMLFEGNQHLFEKARQLKLRTSIDVNWDPAWNSGDAGTIGERKTAVRKILPLVNLTHGNVRELCQFADTTELDKALRRIIEWGAEAIVIHYGSRGAGYFDGKDLVIEPPQLATSQVNTTGTGDVLSVCMMLLHHSDAPVRDRLRMANRIVSEFIEGRRQLIPSLGD